MRSVSASTLRQLLGPDPYRRPAYRDLADRVRRLVCDGRLLVGTRLPSERTLTTTLGLSRTTVGAAYESLRADGYVVTRRGSGSVVTLPESAAGPSVSDAGLIPTVLRDGVIDLTCAALPAAAGTMLAYERALHALPRHLAGPGYHPHGLPEARNAIARWFTGRGLATDPDQVVVTSGAHAGLTASLRALVDVGSLVAVETPTYPNALVGLRRSGYRLLGLPLLADGWDVDGIDAALRGSGASVAYLIPDFQNPTGLVMDAPTRAGLADVLRRRGVVPVVDETFAGLGVDADPPEPFASHAPQSLTIGSAAKSWWGGLRVGWVRAPRAMTGPVVEARHSLDLGTAVLEQLVVAELLAAPPSLATERREETRQRRNALVGALRHHLPEWHVPSPPGGLTLWCELPESRGTELARAAERVGVRLARGSQFGIQPGMDRFVRIPFTTPPDLADEVGRRLAEAWGLARDGGAAGVDRPPLIA